MIPTRFRNRMTPAIHDLTYRIVNFEPEDEANILRLVIEITSRETTRAGSGNLAMPLASSQRTKADA